MGFGASAVSDVSNSIHPSSRSTSSHARKLTYIECAREIVAKDGVVGLFGRGLTTKLISNGIQGSGVLRALEGDRAVVFPKDAGPLCARRTRARVRSQNSASASSWPRGGMDFGASMHCLGRLGKTQGRCVCSV